MTILQPKVTIILPVYNVEQYLRQCLDSVVNQTMRDIQIVCINDGATDGSPAILKEYAAKDPRIEVYHQENQGGGSARNAAYPHIHGKYTYFVDPDDWLELDLCQQCWDKAEATEADMVVLRYIEHSPFPVPSPPFDPALPEIRQFPNERHDVVGTGAPWQRFWRSDFFLSNNIRFSEGKRPYNDVFATWKGFVLANRLSVLNNTLYHYRIRTGSYQQTIDEKHFCIVDTFDEVEKMLHENGRFESYKDVFSARKLVVYHYSYDKCPPSLRPKFRELVRRSLSTYDREFCRTAPKNLVPKHIKRFYEMIDGNPGLVSTMNYYITLAIYGITKKSPSQIFHWIIKRIRT